MTEFREAKAKALKWIDGYRQWLSDFHQQTWHYAETACREYRSAHAYIDLLRRQGVTVEEGYVGMPTAFSATWGQSGPAAGNLPWTYRKGSTRCWSATPTTQPR